MGSTVLVTGIGGNVGQGILRNIRAAYGDTVRLIGTDVAEVTAGHVFCDGFHRVPFHFDDSFVDALVRACDDSRPDLLIPSTDGEVVAIGRAAHRLPPFVGAPAEISTIFFDKLATARALEAHGLPFAPSTLPSTYGGDWGEVVVKPRTGRGSRDVHVCAGPLIGFDDRFLVQKRLRGLEITSAFYATRDGRRLGPLTMARRLRHGMTVQCHVVTDYDHALADFADGLLAALPFRGPCNVQAIVDERDGRVVPFEINGRYSGTNSIRSHFGFEDVKWGVEEGLFGRAVETPTLIGGSAVRLMLDVVYPGVQPDEIRPGERQPGGARGKVF